MAAGSSLQVPGKQKGPCPTQALAVAPTCPNSDGKEDQGAFD